MCPLDIVFDDVVNISVENFRSKGGERSEVHNMTFEA